MNPTDLTAAQCAYHDRKREHRMLQLTEPSLTSIDVQWKLRVKSEQIANTQRLADWRKQWNILDRLELL